MTFFFDSYKKFQICYLLFYGPTRQNSPISVFLIGGIFVRGLNQVVVAINVYGVECI